MHFSHFNSKAKHDYLHFLGGVLVSLKFLISIELLRQGIEVLPFEYGISCVMLPAWEHGSQD